MRFGSRVSKRTRIEVVTEGMFTRLVIDDPSLEGVAAVLFDEFHERSLDADLGLALARDAQQGLRPDLKLLVMSATLDGARVAALLGDAPAIESEGRAFPVETRYLGRDPRAPIERQVTEVIERALRAETGSLLVFVPGAGEIRRTESLLKERISDATIDIVALYGALDAPRAGSRRSRPRRRGGAKVVLATSIAETSLTIEGVRIVIDSGLSRVPRYEPDVGITRLETVRVSRAAADQRRGRAGRVEPGVCYRLWDEPQTASLEAYTRPEILSAGPVVVHCSTWRSGVRVIPASLRFSTLLREPRFQRLRRCLPSLAPSIGTAASPRKAASCARFHCRRGSRAWWSMRRPKAPENWLPASPRWSPSEVSGAMTSIYVIGSTIFAATGRSARTMRGQW